MKVLKALFITILIVISQVLVVESVEASRNLDFSIESKSSLIVKSSWSSNLTGTVDLSKMVNVSESYIESKARVYAKLANKEMGLNFTLNLSYNTSAVLEEDKVESTAYFKLSYADYGALAEITPTKRLTIEVVGSTSTTIAEKLNSTLEAIVKPDTGNRLYNAMLANALAYILNETLKNLKGELQRINATLEYNVTLVQGGTAVKVEVETVIPLKGKVEITQLKPPKGALKIKAFVELKVNQTIASIELEVLTGEIGSESLKESINMISSLANVTPQRLEETLDKFDKLLESLNNLIVTLSSTLAEIEIKPKGEETVTPETPVKSPPETNTLTYTETRTPVRQSETRTTLTLLLIGVIAIAVLAASYFLVARGGRIVR